MKALALHQYGGNDELTLVELPKPSISSDDVLIKVETAAVNPVDWKLGRGYLDGFYPLEFPFVPGWDAAGTVVEVGADVTDYKVGDEVLGYLRYPVARHGTYAEYAPAKPYMITRKPAGLSWEQAAGLPLAGLTAYQALDAVAVGEGDTVLIHAAAGGVGSLGVQIARARGARVIGTASEGNHGFLRELGAEPVVYGEGLVERLRVFGGIDAAVDAIGGSAFEDSVAAGIAPERVASIVDHDVETKGGKNIFVEPRAEELRVLTGLVGAGKLTVPVATTYRLEDVTKAWEQNQDGHTRGKIAITVA